MPNPGSDKPLRKVTLNLYDEDLRYIEAKFGWGWSQIIRTHIHDFVHGMRKGQGLTVGDLE